MTAPGKVDVYERITTQIAAALKAGTVPWHKPWAGGLGSFPLSMSSGKQYRGINMWVLTCESMEKGYGSPWWGTYKQIGDQGGQVRKGERAVTVMLFRPLPCKEHGVERCRACGSAAVARGFSVFNAAQADGLPCKYAHVPDVDRAVCESVVARYLGDAGPVLAHSRGDRAYYSPKEDRVCLPEPDQFESADAYYSTAFHELTHSTGHASRLARKDLLEFHRFGDQSYSREELCAEMGAAFLSGVTGIDQTTVPRSAAYIDHWLATLRGDKRLLAGAAADAQKAADLILGLAAATVGGEVAA